jgi:hypothetical protein
MYPLFFIFRQKKLVQKPAGKDAGKAGKSCTGIFQKAF